MIFSDLLNDPQEVISALARLTHRGAVAADGKTGDGCGLLIKFPFRFLRAVGEELGFTLAQRFAAGTVFLSRDKAVAAAARESTIPSSSCRCRIHRSNPASRLHRD